MAFNVKMSVYGGVFKWKATKEYSAEDYLKTSGYRYDSRDRNDCVFMYGWGSDLSFTPILPNIYALTEFWEKFNKVGLTSQYITLSIDQDSPIAWYKQLHKKNLGKIRDRHVNKIYKLCQELVSDLIVSGRLDILTPKYWNRKKLDALCLYSIDNTSIWDGIFYENVVYWGEKIMGFYD